jgi:hypothetical protein
VRRFESYRGHQSFLIASGGNLTISANLNFAESALVAASMRSLVKVWISDLRSQVGSRSFRRPAARHSPQGEGLHPRNGFAKCWT